MTARTTGSPAPGAPLRDSAPDGNDVPPTPPGSEGDREIGSAVAFVLRSTRQRLQTRAELDEKLAGRGHPSEVRKAALDRAAAAGAVDDEAFARAWVADRGEGRGFAVARLRTELARRRVPEPIAEAALDGLAERDVVGVATELARARAARLPANLDQRVVCRRLVGYLVRRGYDHGLATRVGIDVAGVDRAWD